MLRKVASVLAVLILTAAPAIAQSTYGSITGTITDPSGAVIPGAKVQVTNQSTGFVRSGETNSEGYYEVVNLDAGAYAIAVTMKGFAQATIRDIHLLAREVVRQDLQLRIAGIAGQVVEVRAETITSETLTVSDSKSGSDINTLALNFRATNDISPIKVATLAPAVQTDRLGNISVAGGLPNMTSFSLDGFPPSWCVLGVPAKTFFRPSKVLENSRSILPAIMRSSRRLPI